VGDQTVRRGENVGGASIVLLELHHRGGGIIAFEFEDVGDFRAAEAVDGLVVIADDADVVGGGDEGAEEAVAPC
jgi:hypothetical protein